MKRAAFCLASASALALSLGAAAGSPPRPSGLYGVVMRGPVTPVCTIGVPCDAPAVGVTLAFGRIGRAARTVRTDAAGRYRIRLTAGSYNVRTSARPFGVVPQPASVRVLAGRFRRVDLIIDTGIR